MLAGNVTPRAGGSQLAPSCHAQSTFKPHLVGVQLAALTVPAPLIWCMRFGTLQVIDYISSSLDPVLGAIEVS
jgi:hypothetical protein